MRTPEYETRSQCASCSSSELKQFSDFGKVALAGGFLQRDQIEHERSFPLRLAFCEKCYLVQVIDIINEEHLFKDYFYFSSAIKTLQDHFIEYANEMASRFNLDESSTVVEFGCNDGVLLKPLANLGLKNIIGIDPATNVIGSISDDRINLINDFFTTAVAKNVREKFGLADLILANNVFAHIPNILDATNAVKTLLAPEGVFVFETHYLTKVISELQYDMIYHEHLYYYSLSALVNHFDQFDMKIFDTRPVPTHAGSMRYYVCHKNSKVGKVKSLRTKQLLEQEMRLGLTSFDTYKTFEAKIAKTKVELVSYLSNLKKAGLKIAGYGASGRANTIIQYCKINSALIDYMIDDAPAKQGFYTPGSHIEILTNEVLMTEHKPDYLVIFAWSFFSEIASKCRNFVDGGGKLIVPLPNVQVTMSPNSDLHPLLVTKAKASI